MEKYKGSGRKDGIEAYKRFLSALNECGMKLNSFYYKHQEAVDVLLNNNIISVVPEGFETRGIHSYRRFLKNIKNNGDTFLKISDYTRNGFIFDIKLKSGIVITTNICGYRNFKDLSGNRFGNLTVVGFDKERSAGGEGSFWFCLCDCANGDMTKVKSISASALQQGATLTCGASSPIHIKNNEQQKKKALNRIKKSLQEVNGKVIGKYIDGEHNIECSIDNVNFFIKANKAVDIFKNLKKYKETIIKENDTYVGIIGYTNRGFKVKIKTFENVILEYYFPNYIKYVTARKKLFTTAKENGDTIISPYKGRDKKILVSYNRDFCIHKPHSIYPDKYVQGQKCPYCNQSNGETVIQNYLNNNNIKWQKDYRILTENIFMSRKKYDLFLPQFNLLIEVQGFQHYHDKSGYKRKRPLKEEQENDKAKKDYALSNNFNFMEIDHKEGDCNLTLHRFKKQFNEFLESYNLN